MWEWLKQLFSDGLGYIKFWAVIDAWEVGVKLSGGKFSGVKPPGTYLKWPIYDFYHSVVVTRDTLSVDEVNITTSDGQTISIGCMVEYEVEDAKMFLIDTNDARSNMKDICRGVLSSTLEEVGWEEIKKKPIMNRIQKKLETKYKDMGVKVIDVMFTDKCKTFAFKVFHNRANPDISVTHI